MTRTISFLLSLGALVLAAACTTAPTEARGSSPRLETKEEQDAAAPRPMGIDDMTVPTDGFQVADQGVDIAPGEDVEYCEIAELPGDPSQTYYVGSLELGNAEHSHHLVVAVAEPNSDADATLRSMNIGDHVVCNGANYEFPQNGLLFFASAQTPYLARSYPQGIGSMLHGGQRIVFDYHYLNTSENVVHARSAMNVHLVDSATIKHVAAAFSFFNYTVDVPPHETGKFTAECHFKDDLMVTSILRHTHQQGRDFSVWYAGGDSDGDLVWTSHDWKNEPDYTFKSPVLVKANDGFKFECDFENPNDTPLRYGIRGTDEMCILAGWFWPAGDARELPPADCAVTWVDSKGIGHPADESGGFPKASSFDAKLCRGGLSLTGVKQSDTCTSCLCDSCGSVLMRCAADDDCSALVDCFSQGCSSEIGCIQKCKTELHDHSSAIGMMESVEACMSSKCAGCGPAGG